MILRLLMLYPKAIVALLAEGVDRNAYNCMSYDAARKVALLAEGVDRNIFGDFIEALVYKSPSSRRAWIEMKGSSRSAVS